MLVIAAQSMSDLEDSKKLVESCNQLIKLTDSLVDIKIPYEDNIGFMGMCFLSKQTDHLKNIVKLTPSKDTQLIARSMIEGMCQLFWADRDSTRATQWRTFAWVNDWRLIEESENKGQTIPENKRNAIEVQVKKHEDIFLRPKYRKLKSEGKTIPRDPYYENWRCGISIRAMCDDVGASQLYGQLYGSFSDWQHWGVGSLGLMLANSGTSISYRGRPSDSNASLAVGFQCLIQTLQYLDHHLQLGLNEKIESVKRDYVDWNTNK